MTEYEYEIDAYYIKSGETKAIFFHDNTDNYPDAMNCYKRFKESVLKEVNNGEVINWFLNLSRISTKGINLYHVNIKSEGTF